MIVMKSKFCHRILKKFKRLFNKIVDPRHERSKFVLFLLFFIAIAILILMFIVGLIFFYFDIDGGKFGDFFGGTVNPLLTFLSFMGLLITIVLQQVELKETRLELKRSASALESQLESINKQNFETTFFEMLTLHNNIVNSIDLHYSSVTARSWQDSNKQREVRGRDCFKRFYQNYKDVYNTKSGESEKIRLQQAYQYFWENRQQDLAHYFRYLYNILRFVHEYSGNIDKMRYVRILRAQLSDYELVLLFYNGLDQKGIKYWKYIDEYSLFDNLPLHMLISEKHKNYYSDKSFGEPRDLLPTVWPPRDIAGMSSNSVK